MKEFLTNLSQKYREFKDSIPTNTGKLAERILFFIVAIGFLLFIPIVFVLLSTLMGAGTISVAAYQGVFYTTWVVLLISLALWLFFKEFKDKE